jgi:hypothetical protein
MRDIEHIGILLNFEQWLLKYIPEQGIRVKHH